MEQKEKKRRKKKSSRGAYYDYNLLAIVILLICFGLIMLYSTSAYEAQMKFHGDDMYYFRRQALISVGAIAVAIFISKWDYHLMIPFAGTLYLISVVLMAMVRFTPFGVEAYGSRRWLKLGIQFQPAEIAKIAIIIYMPILVIKMGKQVKQLRAVIWLLIFGMIQAGAAFVFTDNLSTGMIIGGIAVVMIFIAHPKTKPFVVLALGTSVVAAVAKQYGVPVYICAPTSTIDMATATGADICIEQRKAEEVTEMWYKERMAPEGVKVYNPAFDVTDHELIAGIVTEYGVARVPYTESLKEIMKRKAQRG